MRQRNHRKSSGQKRPPPPLKKERGRTDSQCKWPSKNGYCYSKNTRLRRRTTSECRTSSQREDETGLAWPSCFVHPFCLCTSLWVGNFWLSLFCVALRCVLLFCSNRIDVKPIFLPRKSHERGGTELGWAGLAQVWRNGRDGHHILCRKFTDTFCVYDLH